MSKPLTPRLAIVTGADGGIGRAFCRELAGRGCGLVLVSITDLPLRNFAEELSSEYHIPVYPLTLDLTADDSTCRLVSFLLARGLEPDMLVNNAGIFSFLPLQDMDEVKLSRFIDLHVRSLTELSREFGRRFAANGRGWILNMSSMSCWMPMPGLAMYSATKAYIRVLSRALHYELRDYGVSVMVAAPGGIATDLFGLPPHLMRLALRLGAVSTPEKFASGAVKRCLKGKQQYINGLLNRLSIVAVGATPRSVRMLVKRLLLDKGVTRP